MSNVEQEAAMEIAQPSTSSHRLQKSFKNECVTQVEPIVLTQRWTVNNFPTLMKLSRPGVCLRSNIFRDQIGSDSCWQLCLYPGGKREENINHVSLFLKMSATSPMKEVLVKAEYRFYFLDDNEQPRFSNVNIGDFHAKPPKGGHSWGLRNIPKQKVANCVRTDGSLVISCVIELMPDMSRVFCRRVSTSMPTPMVDIARSHSDRELAMFIDEKGCDVLLEADGSVFKVHKFKLVAHSPVFNAMFAHESTKEAQEGRVVIPDVTASSVKTMIEFMYTGRIVGALSVDDAYEVIQMAEKYDLNDLKNLCEDMLITSTDKNNVAEHATLADYHQANHLLNHCIQIMSMNRAAVLASEGWTTLRTNNSRLATYILERMITTSSAATPPSPPPIKRSRL